MTNLLIVCMGNICRSPMAHAVTTKLIAAAGRTKDLKVDSAGTHAHHSGERPDPRALAVLQSRGYDGSKLKSRRISTSDFQKFDLILAMDSDNLAELRRICPDEHQGKLRLFLTFAEGHTESEVPDPYYGNAQGFSRVMDLCETGAKGLLKNYGL